MKNHWPEMTTIEGVTAKQIGFAWALRETYILQNPDDCAVAYEHYLYKVKDNAFYEPSNALERILFWYKNASTIISEIKSKDNEIVTRPRMLGYENLNEIIECVEQERNKNTEPEKPVTIYTQNNTLPLTTHHNKHTSAEICEQQGNGYVPIKACVCLQEGVDPDKTNKYILDGVWHHLGDMDAVIAGNNNKEQHCTLISIEPKDSLLEPLIVTDAYNRKTLHMVLNGREERDAMIQICKDIIQILTMMKEE